MLHGLARGNGVCGRELCCSTWLSEFKNVATSAARYQNLSLNPSKLSGQCGRLKCCLNYELETYMDALEDIPKIEGPLLTEKGEATLQKTDIFRKIMWFGFREENTWYPLNVSRVNEILRLNRETSMKILGPMATLHAYDSESRKKLDAATGNPFLGMITESALFSPGPAIYGGTDQIQKNIIGERVLGLPKEPGIDSKSPFKDLPKNT